MQLIKGAAVSGVAIAALVASGTAAAPSALAASSAAGLAAAAPASATASSTAGLAAVALASAAAASVSSPSLDPPSAGRSPTSSSPSAAPLTARTVPPAVCRPAPPHRHRQWLDGFLLGWVPPGIGPMVTDFEYELDDVGFRSRVWESGPYPDESYRVDLQVTVMRSPSFTDESALREFLVEYLERDPAAWATTAFAHPDGPGFADIGELFWLAAPGVAVRVFGGGEQLDFRDLTRTACAVRQVVPME
ncbi:hypothetical protein [Jiangella anatolica]|uniref:DUF3558 domain-containing protein n=1 Tax=Jiangella anatolica TaxID=2670374 RepID=A0A2W2C3X8_9ACTN|nr:hypothetical protein [Jiangella anatolica]PZF80456.1 hypothetical protein C1I92_25970 [Jiangella anatolica]